LLESKRNSPHESFLDSTYGIFFFGTPHQGLRTDELEEVVDVNSGKICNLIAQLYEGSEFLENQKQDLLPIFERLKERTVVSFYEVVKTPSIKMVIKSSSLTLKRDVIFLHAFFIHCNNVAPVVG